MTYKYFTNTDFETANPPCSIEDMDEELLEDLDEAREIAGIPFVINSAYRTKEHEFSKGRDGTSSHTKGKAVDIRAISSRERFLILKALLTVGFNRIGISIKKGFIHVDNDKEKDADVIWGYVN